MKKKRRKILHIGALVLGIYFLFLGGGTLLVNLTELAFGSREWVIFVRALLGAVLTGAGFYALWDAIRDLLPSRKREEPAPAPQFIFTGATGERSSHVTAELLREQIALVTEEARHIALQPVTPMPAGELGELLTLTCVHTEEGVFLLAVFHQGDGVQVRQKPVQAGEAEKALLALSEGKLPDVSGWEPVEAVVQRPEPQQSQRLILIRDNGRNDHEFFSARDLDLAVTGLEDGIYRQAVVQLGPNSISAVPGADGAIALCLRSQTPDGVRAWRRSGTPAQARFWLVQFYDGSLFQSSGEGWEAVTP